MFTKKSAVKTFISVLLTALLVMGTVFPAGALSLGSGSQSGASAFAVVFDKVWDKVADFVINVAVKGLLSADTLGLIVKSRSFPTVDEYAADEEAHEYFYEGTNGKAEGTAWKLGYESASIIPAQWRVNADGKADPNGMNLNKTYYFGGYFGSTVEKIYDDERVSLVVLSAGNDANGNGIEDIIILGSIDNIGVANGSVREVRAAVSKALQAQKGIAADDIVAFELNATHAHTVIEALGMSLGPVFKTALGNHFLFKKDTAIEPELLEAICNNTAAAAVSAYDKMEDGTLYYFETENVNEYMKANAYNENPGDTVRDKLEYGADNQKFFGCWYFEGNSGEKTVLANIGLHPTFAGRSSCKVCADVPHYMWKAMAEAGYNFVFIQGSQAAIGLSSNYTKAGYDWALENTLTYNDWVARYGKSYADERYFENDDDSGEMEYFRIRATGYSLAHFIIDSINTSNAVAPVYDIKMSETLMPLDYSIMYLAAVSNAFGYNTVKYKGSETGYGIVTEIGYVQLGNDVAMVMLPGEVSPTLIFGTDEAYTGENRWQGAGSWTGNAWAYDTVENYAKNALGVDRILAMGICNDELGYIMPDTDTANNFLTKTFLASMGEVEGRADNEELMMSSQAAGSSLVQGYVDFFNK